MPLSTRRSSTRGRPCHSRKRGLIRSICSSVSRDLYAIEADIRGKDPSARLAIRQERSAPIQVDTIEYAYLKGEQGASIETRNGFDVDRVEIKCRLDFGATAIDWQGLYKNPGA